MSRDTIEEAPEGQRSISEHLEWGTNSHSECPLLETMARINIHFLCAGGCKANLVAWSTLSLKPEEISYDNRADRFLLRSVWVLKSRGQHLTPSGPVFILFSILISLHMNMIKSSVSIRAELFKIKVKLSPKSNQGFICYWIWVKPSCKNIITTKEALLRFTVVSFWAS